MQFDETSSFLPFTPINKENSIKADEPFVDIPRPYVDGFVPTVLDNGEAYDAKLEASISQTTKFVRE